MTSPKKTLIHQRVERSLEDPDIVIHTYPTRAQDAVDVYSCSAKSQSDVDAFFTYFKSTFNPERTATPDTFKKNLLADEGEWLSNTEAAFTINYRVRERLIQKQSKYHTIDIVENGIFGKMLFLNGEMQTAERYDGVYFDALIQPLRTQPANKLNDIAILGGGSGGTVHKLLQQNPKKVVVVDIDAEVIDLSKQYLHSIHNGAFDAKNVEVIITDVSLFLTTVDTMFDAVVYDLSDYSYLITSLEKRDFLDTTLVRIKKSMKSGGLFCMHCCSEFDSETLTIIKSILLKHFVNVTFTKAFVPSFCENWVFASAEKEI